MFPLGAFNNKLGCKRRANERLFAKSGFMRHFSAGRTSPGRRRTLLKAAEEMNNSHTSPAPTPCVDILRRYPRMGCGYARPQSNVFDVGTKNHFVSWRDSNASEMHRCPTVRCGSLAGFIHTHLVWQSLRC